MVALFDIDSLFYLATYKMDTPQFIEKCGLSNEDYETIVALITELAYDRLLGMIEEILEDIASDPSNISITSIEYFVTDCHKSIRKQLSPKYKSNRPKNDFVSSLRKYFLIEQNAFRDDFLEADDLLADRARELGIGNFITITQDKDLIQIPSWYYSYYKKPSKKDQFGHPIETFSRKGLKYVSHFESRYSLAKQLIMGDSGDCVDGLPRYGEKKAEKILEGCKSIFGLKKAVLSAYKKVYKDDWRDELLLNFRLLYLGKL